MIPSLDLNALELDGYGYPIIPDYGPSKGLLYELRSSMKGSNFLEAFNLLEIKAARDKSGSDLENAIAFQKDFTKHIIENLKFNEYEGLCSEARRVKLRQYRDAEEVYTGKLQEEEGAREAHQLHAFSNVLFHFKEMIVLHN
ncbi:hypothetical protein L7F22_005613 [Adiantum nelumboides]|nr:hypothetical protein [Adiantum nelumboides]